MRLTQTTLNKATDEKVEFTIYTDDNKEVLELLRNSLIKSAINSIWTISNNSIENKEYKLTWLIID